MTDERLNLTSASSFEADALCPGRRQFINTLTPDDLAKDEPDEMAERGSRIHKARETGNTLELDEEELEIYKRGCETEQKIVAQWCQDFGIEHYHEGPREMRLFLHWPDTMQVATSGQLDVHYLSGRYVLAIDWKTLWAVHLTPAEKNYQARVQAVIVSNEYNPKHVRVAFNKAMWGRSDQVDYNESDLLRAEQSIFYHLWESNQPGAQRRPGPACRYCPARWKCPEAGAYSLLPSVRNLDAQVVVESMSPQDLATVWERSGIITKILEAVKSRLKSLPEDQLVQLGLKFKEGRKLDSIVDIKGAFEKLKAAGFSEEDILAAMLFGKSDLVEMVRRYKPMSKDDAGKTIDRDLDEFIKRDRAEKSVVKI